MLQPTDRVIAKIIANAAADVSVINKTPDEMTKSAITFASSIQAQTNGNPPLQKAVWELIVEVEAENLAISQGLAVPNTGAVAGQPRHDQVD